MKNADRTEGWDERKEATSLSVLLQGSIRESEVGYKNTVENRVIM